jgi:hypothetical protein
MIFVTKVREWKTIGVAGSQCNKSRLSSILYDYDMITVLYIYIYICVCKGCVP